MSNESRLKTEKSIIRGAAQENEDDLIIIQNMLPRENIEINLNLDDNFLEHHLKHELFLSTATSMRSIRRRQLFEHLWLQTFWGNYGGVKELNINFAAYQESLASAWIQTTFLDIWESTQEDFVVKQNELEFVRKTVS